MEQEIIPTLNEVLDTCEDLEKLEDLLDIKNGIKERLGFLSPRERRVIELRFGLEDGERWTLEKIGREFGLGRERVRQIEVKALKIMLQGKDPSSTKCLNCGRIVGNILRRGKKFCDEKCSVEYYRERDRAVYISEDKMVKCLNCDKEFIFGKKKKFCSFECGVVYHGKKNNEKQRNLYNEFKQWKKEKKIKP